MSTSGVTDFTMTAREVIQKAMEKAAIVSPGETFEASEGETALTDLNLMLKSWQTDGNLWRQDDDELTVTAAKTTLTPRVIDLTEVRLVANGRERPLARWEWGDYVGLPNKAQAGTPSCYALRRNRATIDLYLWPAPTSAVIRFTASRVIEDVTDLENEIDVPQEWLECVILNLADRMAPSYGTSLSDREQARALDLLAQMRDADRPASYYMGPYR